MKRNEQKIDNTLTEIVNIYGIDIFKEHKRVYSLISDMASGDSRVKERRRIRAALESGAVDILFKAVDDKTDCELCINESVAHLILKTDMAENVARETILSIATAFSLTVPQLQTDIKKAKKVNVQTDSSNKSLTTDIYNLNHVNEMHRKRNKKRLKLFSIFVVTFVFAIVTALVGAFLELSILKYWLLGISSGIVITGFSIGISYAFQEFILFNEMCQTITITNIVFFVSNIVLRIVIGADNYSLIFRIITVFIAVMAIANAIYTRIDVEDKWTWPNVLVVIFSIFLFFIWPGNISWMVWQWIIGIGGGLFLAAIVFAVIDILDVIGPEMFVSLTVALLILTIVNILLLHVWGENYLIISQCFMVMLSIGAIVGIVMCYNEAATGLQVLNVILLLINCGAFLFLVLEKELVTQIVY